MSDPIARLTASLALPAVDPIRPTLPGESLPPAAPQPHSPAPSLPPITVPTEGGASLVIGRGELTARDRKLFGGTAAAVQSGMTDGQVLSSIGCDFKAVSVPALYRTAEGIRESSESRIWYRGDSGEQLGSFGNRRQPIQPADYLEGFRRFCAASGGALSLDVVGSLKGGKTLYFASKLAGRMVSPYAQENRVGDVVSQWLIISDFYGESRRPRATLMSNNLVCCNGMSKQVNTSFLLSHTAAFDTNKIAEILHSAASESAAYLAMMDTLIERRVTLEMGEQILRDFYKEEPKIANKIVSIYRERLIGGNLPERGLTGWRVMSAVTQYNSHERIGRADVAFASQLSGPRALASERFSQHLLTVTA